MLNYSVDRDISYRAYVDATGCLESSASNVPTLHLEAGLRLNSLKGFGNYNIGA